MAINFSVQRLLLTQTPTGLIAMSTSIDTLSFQNLKVSHAAHSSNSAHSLNSAKRYETVTFPIWSQPPSRLVRATQRELLRALAKSALHSIKG